MKSKLQDIKYPLMVRDFIKDRLYSSTSGYFQKEDVQVGSLKEPIDFRKLLGYYAYRKELQKVYPKNAWVTQSELFKPYYGYMIANYIVTKHQRKGDLYVIKIELQTSKPIKIIEIGPGTGVLSKSIIEFVQNYCRNKLEYHLVEI